MKLLTLRQDEAKARSSKISDIEYKLFLQLTPEVESKNSRYSGKVSISFSLNSIEENIFLDFTGFVNKIEINGKSVGLANIGERIYLKKEYLVLNENKVLLDFTSSYGHETKGLIYYHDKKDYKSYVYSNLEPCYSHLLFPCFNQPDLKAKIQLFVSCLDDWNAISSAGLVSRFDNKKVIEERVKQMYDLNPEVAKGYSLFEFDWTKKIPVHLFGFAAGHYDKIPNSQPNTGLDINLYLRATLKNPNHEKLFNTLRSATYKFATWIKTNISTEYFPQKIDIVFVPKFDVIGQPNQDCLFIDDDFFTTGEISLVDKNSLFYNLCSLVAQQWFGVLITPTWWDDLWMSKAFSNYFAFHIVKQICNMVLNILTFRTMINTEIWKTSGCFFPLRNPRLC